MTKLAVHAFSALLLVRAALAVDLSGLTPIGPLASYKASQDSVTVECRDHSQVRFYILAPDLIRVRVSFRAPLAARDHSWAIAKTKWDVPQWTVKDDRDDVVIATDEVEAVVHRSPLLVEFRDAKTHEAINADHCQ